MLINATTSKIVDGGDVEEDADLEADFDGVCRDRKGPTEDRQGKAFPNPAASMASLSRSNAANSPDPDAETCNCSSNYRRPGRAGSTGGESPPRRRRKPVETAEENPARKSSSPSESPSKSRSFS